VGGRPAALAYPGLKGQGVWLRNSGDGGATWGPPEGPYLNATPTTRRFPVLALDGAGNGLVASYVPDGAGATTQHVHAIAVLGGHAKGPALQVSWNATTLDSKQDYFAGAAWNGRAWLAWLDGAFNIEVAPVGWAG
jgi:hypothetical protein